MKYYDSSRNRIIYVTESATADFWDDHWEIAGNLEERAFGKKDTFVSRVTRRYVEDRQGPILEGGCGTGQFVASLWKNGYRVVGLDFGQRTIRAVKEKMPGLSLALGDVRALPFRDRSMLGYWSLGLIEHFWGGYDEVRSEMTRVLCDGGYLFVTFPYMSPLRRMKGWLGLYRGWSEGGTPPTGFHQFALDAEVVEREFKKEGFRLVKRIPHDAVTGAREEIPFLRGAMEKLSNNSWKFRVVGYVNTLWNRLLSWLMGHCVLLVLQKELGADKGR